MLLRVPRDPQRTATRSGHSWHDLPVLCFAKMSSQMINVGIRGSVTKGGEASARIDGLKMDWSHEAGLQVEASDCGLNEVVSASAKNVLSCSLQSKDPT